MLMRNCVECIGSSQDFPAFLSPLSHLNTLRSILERDYLATVNWSHAVIELLEIVRTSLGGGRSMVALWDGHRARWDALLPSGERLNGEVIADYGSMAVLNQVRASESPLLATDDEALSLTSESIQRHHIGSVIAVPLYWWETTPNGRQRTFSGCIYAHRVDEEPQFTQQHVDLILDIARIAQPVLNALRHVHLLEEGLEASNLALAQLRDKHLEEFRLGNCLTRDPQFHKTVLAPLLRAGELKKVSVLLLGPTGSGKTHLAEAFHHDSQRQNGPFVTLDCAQVTSAETLSAELFGYAPESGYHNSPRRGRAGKAKLADKGTLFIDEIACLPPELQQRLLRLIERGTFCPLGSGEEILVDLQVVVATNEDLELLVAQKRFREDLYWRLAQVVIRIPPLNEHPADIPDLAEHFLTSACQRLGRKDIQALSVPALQGLLRYDWSRAGNVRGLEQFLLRAVIEAPPGTELLRLEDLRLPVSEDRAFPLVESGRLPFHTPASSKDPELESIKQAIRQHGYATKAAHSLGITHRQLTWRLQRAGLRLRDILSDRC